MFNLVVEIRKKEDLRGLEFDEILGFKSEILSFQRGLMGFEGGFSQLLAHTL